MPIPNFDVGKVIARQRSERRKKAALYIIDAIALVIIRLASSNPSAIPPI